MSTDFTQSHVFRRWIFDSPSSKFRSNITVAQWAGCVYSVLCLLF